MVSHVEELGKRFEQKLDDEDALVENGVHQDRSTSAVAHEDEVVGGQLSHALQVPKLDRFAQQTDVALKQSKQRTMPKLSSLRFLCYV